MIKINIVSVQSTKTNFFDLKQQPWLSAWVQKHKIPWGANELFEIISDLANARPGNLHPTGIHNFPMIYCSYHNVR